MKWTWRILGFGVLVLVLVVVFWGQEGVTSEVASAEVQHGTFVIDVVTRGEVAAVDSRGVSRPRGRSIRGQIVSMAPEGSEVNAGEFLVQFDTSEIDRTIEERRNELLNAQVELESKRAELASRSAELTSALKRQEYSYEQQQIRFRRMEYEAEVRRRVEELELKKSELSLAEAQDAIEAHRSVSEAELSRAELEVKQAETELQEAEEAKAKHTLHAPIDGLVVYMEIYRPGGSSKVKVGDTPWSGMEIIQLPDLSRMKVVTKVNEVDIERVSVGQRVEITVDALAGHRFQGTVATVANLARREEGSDRKSFDVDVVIETEGETELRPGMTASCTIITRELADATFVPLEAVHERQGRTFVFRAGSDDEHAVTLGLRNSDFVVVEAGLEAGDRVTLRDPNLPLEDVGVELNPDGGGL
jgi:RND family efflux transporter MFP subunit